MTAIPATFRAFVATQEVAPAGDDAGLGADDATPIVTRGVRTFAEADLPPGEVEVRVAWSSVNYKDGLATRADGKVARISPLIPGIDLAGEVVASADPAIAVGSAVLAHGYELGVSRHGGYTEYQRVPAGWVVPAASTSRAPRTSRSARTSCWRSRPSTSSSRSRNDSRKARLAESTCRSSESSSRPAGTLATILSA